MDYKIYSKQSKLKQSSSTINIFLSLLLSSVSFYDLYFLILDGTYGWYDEPMKLYLTLLALKYSENLSLISRSSWPNSINLGF